MLAIQTDFVCIRRIINNSKVKIAMANDANCFALAEANMGIVQEKYPNAKVVFGVIMGTGVGCGVVVEVAGWR